MTARPPRVFMRTKKPWVRLRRVTEGWKVRFIRDPNIKELTRHRPKIGKYRVLKFCKAIHCIKFLVFSQIYMPVVHLECLRNYRWLISACLVDNYPTNRVESRFT